jgi:hypothetical protein
MTTMDGTEKLTGAGCVIEEREKREKESTFSMRFFRPTLFSIFRVCLSYIHE